MKLKKVFPIMAALLVGLVAGCEKNPIADLALEKSSTDKTNISSSEKSSTSNSLVNQAQSKILAVNLGVAGDFAILSKSGITDVYKSAITGNIGSSPITGAAILVACDEVVGTIYSVDAAGPFPCAVTNASMLTTAVGDMQTAYTDAAGRINPDFLNLGAGDISGLTLSPGLYNWSSALVIPTDVTLTGGPNDVFIFQVSGTLTMSSGKSIILSGGVQASNIFWVVADAVTIGTTAHFEGNILGQTGINLQTSASINGRMLAQTAVTLQMNTVVMPQANGGTTGGNVDGDDDDDHNGEGDDHDDDHDNNNHHDKKDHKDKKEHKNR